MSDPTKEWEKYPEAVHVISLGAGVQSSTLAEMADAGEIAPKPIAGVFGDTQAEPASVYKWLAYLEKRLSFPILKVTHGSLVDKELTVTRSGRSGRLYRHNKIPLFTDDEGTRRMMPRMCTMDFKIKPVIRAIRELCHIPRGCKEIRVIQWIGISTDEALRMKPSQVPWIVNRWPLIEKGISRRDCLQYWEERGLPKPPKSACSFCPYHNDLEWKRLKKDEPEEFQKAVDFERRVQKVALKSEVSAGVPFLHKSLVPLSEVKFTDDKTPLFTNECQGMCGV
jgi:hypothetical protein